MIEQTIAGKKFILKSTYGAVKKIRDKFDVANSKDWTTDEHELFILKSVWAYTQKRWYGFKPFISFRRFKNSIEYTEVLGLTTSIKTLMGADLKNE